MTRLELSKIKLTTVNLIKLFSVLELQEICGKAHINSVWFTTVVFGLLYIYSACLFFKQFLKN